MRTRILGIIGSLLLIAGLFVPIVSVFGISVNYFNTMGGGYNDGYIFLGIGIVSLIIAIININRLLILTGLAALGTVAMAYIGFKSRMSDSSSSELNARLAETVQLEWGWAVLILGGIVLLVAGILKKSSAPPAPTGYGAPPPGYGPPPGYNQPPPPPGYPPGPGQPPPYGR